MFPMIRTLLRERFGMVARTETSEMPVLALPEGDWLRASNGVIELKGPREAYWFRAGEKSPVRPGRLHGT